MERSTEHILVSHVGRLPDPKSLEPSKAVARTDPDAFAAALPDAVRSVVADQVERGVDVVNDGELGKVGEWTGYVRHRLGGFEEKVIPGLEPLIGREQREEFPEYSVGHTGGPQATRVGSSLVCTGPVVYTGHAEIARDIANLRAAVEGLPVTEVFMAAVSPDNINYQPHANEYYADEDEFTQAKADAMATEYQAIVDAGFLLQIDMPVMKFNMLSLTVEEFRDRFARVVEILNATLATIPSDRVRIHVCYGSGINAHTGDIGLGEFIDLLLRINADGLSFDQNVRHEHEWALFGDLDLPDNKVLMPGVASQFTQVVEHPELIAQRLVRLANVVGRERVIAGTDCGLGRRLHREIAWAKLAAMGEGARIATKTLWS